MQAQQKNKPTRWLMVFGLTILLIWHVCLIPARDSPERYYHDVWKKVDDHYLHRERLETVGWKGLEHKYDGQLKTYEDAHEKCKEIIALLNDPYTQLRTEPEHEAVVLRLAEPGVVQYKMIQKSGYVKIRTFTEKTRLELEGALEALNREGATDFIVDLRGNAGGFVGEAFGSYAMSVDEGKFATIRGYNRGLLDEVQFLVRPLELETISNGRRLTSPRVKNLTGSRPVNVLIDKETASSAEMLAGALQESGRAKLLGTRSYGKGIAQRDFKFRCGARLMITFAEICQPSGRCIHGIGLTPDSGIIPSFIDSAPP